MKKKESFLLLFLIVLALISTPLAAQADPDFAIGTISATSVFGVRFEVKNISDEAYAGPPSFKMSDDNILIEEWTVRDGNAFLQGGYKVTIT